MNINPDDPFDAAVRHRSFTGDRDLSTLSEIPSILTPHTKENMSIPPPPYSSVSVSQSSHTSSSLSVTTSADATISQPPLLPLGMAPSPIGETVSSNLISCIGSKNSPGASNSTGDVTKSNSINNELTPNEDESGSGSAGTAPSSSANGADDGAGRSGNNQGNNATNTTGSFECNICLDPAKDAVVSLCGHLFCWPCLHQWLETTTQARAICPVCKAAISRNKVIPIYGRGGDSTQDPRNKIPPRPAGRRQDSEATWSTFGTGWSSLFGNGANFVSGRGGANGNGGVLRMSVGIGSFPFGLFATTFNFGGFGFGSGSGGGSSVGLAGSGSSGASGTAGGGVVGAAGQSANGFAGFQPLGDDLLLNNSDAERMSQLCIILALLFIAWLLFA